MIAPRGVRQRIPLTKTAEDAALLGEDSGNCTRDEPDLVETADLACCDCGDHDGQSSDDKVEDRGEEPSMPGILDWASDAAPVR